MKINYKRDKLSKERRYPCSLQQIRKVVSELPRRYTSGIKQIRLSNRKRFRGPAVAFEESGEIEFFAYDNHLFISRERQKPRLSRMSRITMELLEWGVCFVYYDGYWWLAWSPEDLANYALHHVLLHEIGHLYGYSKGIRRGKLEEYAENFADHLGTKYKPRTKKRGKVVEVTKGGYRYLLFGRVIE